MSLVLATSVLIGGCSGGSKPGGDDAKAALLAKIAENPIKPMLLENFEKVDSIERIVDGVAVHEVDWVTKARFPEATCLNNQNFPTESNYGACFHGFVKAGQVAELTGKTTFEKSDNGWRPISTVVVSLK